jgi:5-bromo-4-chloroindolyl phosphate hydrolysis protein
MEKMQVYEVNEFILEMSDILSEDLKELLRRNVNRVQFYLDEQILEPG